MIGQNEKETQTLGNIAVKRFKKRVTIERNDNGTSVTLSDMCKEVLKWKHPFTCIVGGPSGSGKTSFVIKL